MKSLLITAPEYKSAEHETISYALASGLDVLHIRKPGWPEMLVKEYIRKIPECWHNKLMVHGHVSIATSMNIRGVNCGRHNWPQPTSKEIVWSKSAHGIDELIKFRHQYAYFMLSPIYDSISKEGYKSPFNRTDLLQFLTKNKELSVYALGGIRKEYLADIKEMGFSGAAFLGAVWQNEDVNDRNIMVKDLISTCQKL